LIHSPAELNTYSSNNPEAGFAKAYWLDSPDNDFVEKELKEKHKITIRCLIADEPEGNCIFSGQPGAKLAIFARAY
jgi:hypothetical protein